MNLMKAVKKAVTPAPPKYVYPTILVPMIYGGTKIGEDDVSQTACNIGDAALMLTTLQRLFVPGQIIHFERRVGESQNCIFHDLTIVDDSPTGLVTLDWTGFTQREYDFILHYSIVGDPQAVKYPYDLGNCQECIILQNGPGAKAGWKLVNTAYGFGQLVYTGK